MLTFRNLRPAEATPALFAGFIRRQVVVDCWRWENGGWTIRPDPFIDDWSAADIAALAAGLRRTLAAGGFVRAAFCGAQLKGFAAAATQPCGAQGEYIDLLELHVSADWRGRGAGTALFAAAAAWARGRGAQKLYISAHSAAETQAFYHRRRLAPPRPHRRRTLRLPAGIRPVGDGQSLIEEHKQRRPRIDAVRIFQQDFQ